jgi:ATP-binding cassette, subfamily C, bacterial CydC
LLLDEPTEHLDAVDAERVMRELLAPKSAKPRLISVDRTVLVATHHLPNGIGCNELRVEQPRKLGR